VKQAGDRIAVPSEDSTSPKPDIREEKHMFPSHRTGALALALAMVAAPSAWATQTLHVPAQFSTIQAAVDAAQAGDTVLVGDGTYTGNGNRDINFVGKQIVVRSENGPQSTTIDAGGTSAEPYRGFVFSNDEGRSSIVEGFTITGGATLPGAVADQFNGGAIIIRSASPTIRDCHFIGNSSGCWGGAIYSGDTGESANKASPLIENCLFANNFTDDDGGGFFTWSFSSQNAEPTIIRNSVFINNGAAVTGGAITDFGGSNLVLENITVVGNTALFGSGLNVGNVTISNSILWDNAGSDDLQVWGNSTISYSNVMGGAPGLGNLDIDPGFAADGYHLLPGSPMVGAGTFSSTEAQLDIDGQPRLLGGRVDIGADELKWATLRLIGGPLQAP